MKNQSYLKSVAVQLILCMVFQLGWPTLTLALTGGPSQPEVQSFEPIGTSEMVDVFSGDFTYNIPLLDVEGYPINISYHSGISTDQEASWVGLGWNINPGVVNRTMRGLPDDFSGDEITKYYSMKDNTTTGVSASGQVNSEIFGKKLKFGSLSLSMGVRYNNYTGWSTNLAVTPGINAGISSAFKLNAGLGISMSSDEGSAIQPNVGVSLMTKNEVKNDKERIKSSLGISFGGSFSSRGGLNALSVNTNVSASINDVTALKDDAGKTVGYVEGNTKGSTSVGLVGTSFDFGQPTYTPQSEMNFRNFGITGTFSLGLEGAGFFGGVSFTGYRSRQSLAEKVRKNKAYGYLNSHKTSSLDALLDFNRENDGGFNESTPALSMTAFTYDLFNVVGQGVGGSYRPFRSDIGTTYDPRQKSEPNDNVSLELELGAGAIAKVGGTIGFARATSNGGKWSQQNAAGNQLKFRSTGNDINYEPVYFKEANEKNIDPNASVFNSIGGSQAVRVKLNSGSKFNVSTQAKLEGGGNTYELNNIQKQKRDNRNQLFTYLTHSEVEAGLGIQPPSGHNTGVAKAHHISEITTLSTDGTRYVYGLPAYNTLQKDYTFAVGAKLNGSNPPSPNYSTGLVNYNTNDASASNDQGIDNYFSATEIPPFAHSYLLTCVLSSDYIDADGIQGPSANDMGNYTIFHYDEVSDYKWRTPVEAEKATFSEGLKTDNKDDKASFVYGEKNLYYLRIIESRNYVAEFKRSPRQDAKSVNGAHGGVNAENTSMERLDAIYLYTRHEWEKEQANPGAGIPTKVVHFTYDYTLCGGITNNPNGEGKLTLKEIYFTYQNSEKARFSSYKFNYTDPSVNGDLNPAYNLKGYDRWGTYKANISSTTWSPGDADMSNSEDPYTPQDNSADVFAQVWHLQQIKLPSGGVIEVDYEADDYAYVQNRKACRMFPIIGSSPLGGSNPETLGVVGQLAKAELSNNGTKNTRLYFELDSPTDNINQYVSQGDEMFYKFLVDFTRSGVTNGPLCEYVPGYAKVKNCGVSGNFGWVELQPVSLSDNNNATDYSPIAKTAIQFARLSLREVVYGTSNTPGEDSQLKQALLAIIDAVSTFGELFTDPNSYLYDDGVGNAFITEKSVIRLRDPDGIKKGGGVRVKEIRMHDRWDPASGVSEDPNAGVSYGQRYIYRLEDGRSSGVASYEPQIGGEENPFKQPVYYDISKKGVPDDRFFVEEPLGESFFPSASVGYSRVVVENIVPAEVTRHATGHVVHEFYTSKDFPTIVDRTSVKAIRHKTDPFSIKSLLKINVKDYMTATQGFSIELNDMHGKPKAQYVYAEGGSSPISSVRYNYKSQDYGGNGGEAAKRLVNVCAAIHPDGQLDNNASLGVMYDIMNDARESKTRNISFEAKGNTDVLPFFGITTFMIWPEKNNEQTQFRSMTTTKVIQRFGILEETIAIQDGSTVSTKTLAYDAKTGEPLLSETITNFDDFVYTLNYPAYWHYKEMGPAYQNMGVKMNLLFDATGKAPVPGGNAAKYFAEGDEISLNNQDKAWVVEVAPTYIVIIDEVGDAIAGNKAVKVIRSGFRNMQMGQMANITTMANPLNSISGNIYEQVLQASAIEYKNQWPTDCACFDGTTLIETTNPFILGTRGYWKPSKSFLHLTGRTQSVYDENTNIRKDGVFESYNPFYRLTSDGSWIKDFANWTYTSEVSLFSPYGPELENLDALERYSSATFGYHQTLPTSVAANASYQEIGFESFEDYASGSDSWMCNDRKFKLNDFESASPVGILSDTHAHTGRYSMRIDGPMKKTYEVPEPCVVVDCGLAMEYALNSENFTGIVEISGGTAPYFIDWVVESGFPVIEVMNTANGVELNIISIGSWSILVTATDANGNTIIQNIGV